MPEERKNPIIRREQITVAHAQQNQYGDLIVKTKAGNELKVGKKRQHLFDVFQPGAEVVVGFSSYMNKEYVNEATQAAQVVATDTPIVKEYLVKEAVKMGAEVISTTNTKDRAVALSYAKDLAVAGKIELKEIIAYANKFLDYILNRKGD